MRVFWSQLTAELACFLKRGGFGSGEFRKARQIFCQELQRMVLLMIAK